MKMQYRKFSDGFDISALGCGTMRLPCLANGEVDYDAAMGMIRYAVDKGINYFDCAWFYHGEHSERCLGKALKGGYREKVRIADKLPIWECKTSDDVRRVFDIQMSRLDVDHIDYYLIHSLDPNNWANAQRVDALNEMEKLKQEGLIGNIGFSFHAEHALFREIIDSYNWAMCMIQYNIIDIDFQAGNKGLKYAHSKGIPVVIMEPLKGSALVNPPPLIREAYPQSELGMSYADIALKFLANHKEIACVLSGMSNKSHVDANMAAVASTPIGSLSPKLKEIIKGMQDIYGRISNIPCTKCKYCLPCPQNVAIDTVFEIYNSAYGFGSYGNHRGEYRNTLTSKGQDVSRCNKCGKCAKHCPQGIDIIAKLHEAHSVLG